MQIPDKALDEFIKLYKKEFKEDILRAEASEMAFRLMALYELFSKKLPNEQKLPPPDDPPRRFHL
jgi:hypothetical protein